MSQLLTPEELAARRADGTTSRAERDQLVGHIDAQSEIIDELNTEIAAIGSIDTQVARLSALVDRLEGMGTVVPPVVDPPPPAPPAPPPEPAPLPVPVPAPVPPVPPPATGSTNEPAGLTVLCDYHCEPRPVNQWQTTQPGYMSGRVQFVSEDGNNLCRFANPAGADDYGMGSIVTSNNESVARSEIYSRFMLRPAANWLAHSIGTKYLYIFAGGGGNHSIPVLGGNTLSEPIRVKMAGSGGFISASQSNPYNWTPNRQAVDIVRGQWNMMEFYGKLNTPGAADGIYRIWVNGRLVMEMTDVIYRTNTSAWGEHDLLLYHGGQGFPIPTASHIDVDYFYVSGR